MILKQPEDHKELRAYFIALYRLRNDEDFRVLRKYLEGELGRLKNEAIRTLDENLLRWNQGAAQVLVDILSNVDESVNRREMYDKKDRDARHKELVKRTAPSGAGESFA